MMYVKFKGSFSGIRTYKQALEYYKNNQDIYCDQSFCIVKTTDIPDEYKSMIDSSLLKNNIYVGYGNILYNNDQSKDYAVVAQEIEKDKFAIIYYDDQMVGINFAENTGLFINSIDTCVVTDDQKNTFFTVNSYLGNFDIKNVYSNEINDEMIDTVEMFLSYEQKPNDFKDFVHYLVTEEYEKFLHESTEYYFKNLETDKFALYQAEEGGVLFKFPLYYAVINMHIIYNRQKEAIISKDGENAFTKDVADGLVESLMEDVIHDINDAIFEQSGKTLDASQNEYIKCILNDCITYKPDDKEVTELGYFYCFDDDGINWARSLFYLVAGNTNIRELTCDTLERLYILGLEEDYGVDYKNNVLDLVYDFESKLEDNKSSMDADKTEQIIINDFVSDMRSVWDKAGISEEDDATVVSVASENVAMFRSLREYKNMDNDKLYMYLRDVIKKVDSEELVSVGGEFCN